MRTQASIDWSINGGMRYLYDMIYLLCSLALATHPTDVLPIASNHKENGLQVVVGGDITGPLVGLIEDNGQPQILSFVDDGIGPDALQGDGVYVAFRNLRQRGGSAKASLQMGEQELWRDQIPIGAVRNQFFLKIFIKEGHAVVKVDTSDVKPLQRHQQSDDRPRKPDKKQRTKATSNGPQSNSVFYENNAFLQTLCAVVFLIFGFALGRTYTPKPALRLRPPMGTVESQWPMQIIGQQQCWECHDSAASLYQLSQYLITKGNVVVTLSDKGSEYFAQQPAIGGIHFCQQTPSNQELITLCKYLEATGPVILIVDGLEALETPNENEEPEHVLKDLIYDLPKSISVLALVKTGTKMTCTHRL